MSLSLVFRALTSDVINQYAFGRSGDYLSMDDYNISYFESVAAFFEAAHLSAHCAWLGPLLDFLPVSLTTRLVPAMGALHRMRKVGPRIAFYTYLTYITLGMGRSDRGNPELER